MPARKPTSPATKKNSRSKPAAKQAANAASAPPAGTSDVAPTVVGIAGSAGALSALVSFFDALPGETGLAFVVVTHLSPEHESHMADLLQAHTKMKVTQVTEKQPALPNRVYVIPPSKNILITDAHVDVAEFEEPRGSRTPIDFFFRTLARSHREAVAIVLSGGGTDGSVGVKDIKEEGGLIMVQDPEEAEYTSMPNAAIATGLVDVVLPARSLADKLMEYSRQAQRPPVELEGLDEEEWDIVQAILAQVQRRTRHDFTQYKRSTILRRVRRRMLLTSHSTLESYLDSMRSHPAECFALLNDLLIGVTNFFRDHKAWDALKREVIPVIFKQKEPSDPIRIWSVGCASGEEAYSLAILYMEAASELEVNHAIQIFASDIDNDSLARAREGLYPSAIEADVSPERLERFFNRQGNHYRVRRELRDMILFTPHSVLRDPPFSRQDLICCRNLLIYLERDIQQYILDVFHYSLLPGGFLFLGSSESTSGQEPFFQAVDKAHRIYQSLPARLEHPHIPTLPVMARPVGRTHVSPSPRAFLPRPPVEPILLDDQHRRSLESFGPPSILVNGDNMVLHVSDTAGRYLSQPKGPVTTDLLKLARPELQGELRSALFRAIEKGRAAISRPIPIDLDGEPRLVILSVYPRPDQAPSGRPAEKQALVVFLEDQPLPESKTAGAAEEAGGRDQAQNAARTSELELEVTRLHEQLQVSQEEYDSSAEEMKAANEELQSINEEYHLTTEELETSKEELEAVNEELQTVNNELKGKLDEISRTQRDLESVMGAMEIATLFLDRDLRIQRYTATLAQFFNILKTDVGRPIHHLSHKLGVYDQLTEDAQKVLDNLIVLDREVQSQNGQWFLIRLRPYRTVEDKIEGVVITFVDVTALKRAEMSLRQLNEGLESRIEDRTHELQDLNRRLEQTGRVFSALFNANPIPTSLTRADNGVFLDVNEAYSRYFGLDRSQVVGHTSRELGLPFQEDQRATMIERVMSKGIVSDQELQITLPSGENRTVLASGQNLEVDGTAALLSSFIDITGRVEAERQIRTLAASLTAAEQKERRRISKILHDDLQQRLFAVKMQLTFLQQAYQMGSTEGILADTKNLETWVGDAIETTRRLSADLSPVVLQNSNLADSAAWLVEEMRERYGLDVTLEVKGRLPILDEHLRVLLYESMRELMFNIVKHSDVLQANVVMQHVDGKLRVSLSDHGKGFDAGRVMSDPKIAHGLLDIRNRLNLLGCSMQVQSQPGHGTQIMIDVPV